MRFSVLHSAGFSGASYLCDLTPNAELRALETESDPELFFEGLFHYGISREQRGDLETAARAYGALTRSDSFRDRARVRLDAILGQGSIGPRSEFLLRRFAAEASDPANIVGMAAAASAFRLARFSVLSQLSLNPIGEGFVGRLGVRFLPSLAGFAVEAPTFTLAGRLTRQSLGQAQDWSGNAWGREIASSYLTLGALRLAVWGSGSTFNFLSETAASRASVFRTVFQQGGTLGGILLGHRLEQAFGLRPRMDGATTLVDSLALLLQFHVGGQLSRRIFGSGLSGMDGDLDLITARLEAAPSRRLRPGPVSAFPPVLAMAVGEMPGGPAKPGRSEVTGTFPPDSSPAYSQYRYPPGGEGGNPRRVLYSPETLRQWQELQTKLRSVPFEASAEEIHRSRVPLQTADSIWRTQIEDFARLVGGELTVHGPERLLEPFSPHFLRRDPALLRRAEEVAGANGGIYELNLPHADAAFGRPNERGDYSSLGSLMREIQETLGDQVFLVNRRNGRLQARIPNFALWEGLLVAKFGDQAHRPVFVDGLIPRDPVMRLRGKLLAPVGLLLQPARIYELKGRVHPFFVPFHDMFHATIASMLPAALCRTSSELYFSLLTGMSNSFLKQEHLNHLADMDPGSEFKGNADEFVIFSLHHFWKSFMRDVDGETMTQRRLMLFPKFIREYQRILLEAEGNPAVDAHWRGRFSQRLEEMLRELNSLLRRVLQR